MRILGNTFYALSVTLLIGVAALFLATLVPITGNIDIKIVRSGSMEPSIQTGGLIIVKPAATYGVGDVITFGNDTTANIPTTHRIVSISESEGARSYITKGDANEEADPRAIAESEVIGKVLFDVPYAGYVLDFAQQPLGFSLLIGLPAALIVLEELGAIWGEVRKIRHARRRGAPRRRMRREASQRMPNGERRTQTVLVRRNVTDDILVPMRVSIRIPEQPVPRKSSFTFLTSFFGVLFVVVVALAFGSVGSTVSYLRNIETAIDNRFISSVLNLDLTFADAPAALLSLATTEEDTGEEMYTGRAQVTVAPGAGSVPLQYHIYIEERFEEGELCDALDMSAAFDGKIVYEGPLLGYIGTTTSAFGEWIFEMVLPVYQGDISDGAYCEADVVFSAWRGDTHLFVDSGYTDEERVMLALSYQDYTPASVEEEKSIVEPQLLLVPEPEEVEEELEENAATSSDAIVPEEVDEENKEETDLEESETETETEPVEEETSEEDKEGGEETPPEGDEIENEENAPEEKESEESPEETGENGEQNEESAGGSEGASDLKED